MTWVKALASAGVGLGLLHLIARQTFLYPHGTWMRRVQSLIVSYYLARFAYSDALSAFTAHCLPLEVLLDHAGLVRRPVFYFRQRPHQTVNTDSIFFL